MIYFSIHIFSCKIVTLIAAHSTQKNHGLNNLKSTLTEDASTQETGFWPIFFRKKDFFYLFLCKNSTPIMTPLPGDHDLNNLNSTLP